jgi:two-component system LytT family response regulator
MKVIVIDDENLALESMVRMLKRFDIEVEGAFQDPREALKHHERLSAEVAFLDIEMPEMGGLELAARLQALNPMLQIVFVTAYEQYAIEAFELAAIDYLLKPIHLKRLEITLKRLRLRAAPSGLETCDPSMATVCMLHHLSFQNSMGNSLEIPWRTTKAKELFAYMIHLGERTPSKDELLDQIWPDVKLEKAVTLLHTTIYQIRQTLKNANIPLRIDYKEGRYRLDFGAGMQVDSHEWEKAVRKTAEQEDSDMMHRLLLSGYRGDYLEREDFTWANGERERIKALWLEHALKNASQMEGAEQYSNAISLHQQIQARFPEIEESYFGLMRLFDKLGNSSEVHRQYDKLSLMLDEDFGMRPNDGIIKWFGAWNDRKTS